MFQVMFYEGLSTAFQFPGHARDVAGMIPWAVEQAGLKMGMRPVAHGECMGPVCPYRDFDALDGLHDQQSQLAVKDVQREDLIERRSRLKLMQAGFAGWAGRLEGKPIGAEAIVAYVGQVALCPGSVIDTHAVILKPLDLIVDRERLLVITAAAHISYATKK